LKQIEATAQNINYIDEPLVL